METGSPVEITEQEAIEMIEELWSELFSVKTNTDTDNFFTDRSMKRTLEDPNNGTPTKSGWGRSAGNLDPLPSGYKRGTCDECVQIVLKEGHLHKKRKKVVPRNWGLLLYMKRASAEEVRNIEDRIGKYLSETLKGSSERRMLNCFVCNRQARGSNHNIKDCIQIGEVSLQTDGHLRYAKATNKPLNNCVRGFHMHQNYVEQLECATNGDGGFVIAKEFARLKAKGATPCPQCGDVFSTHRSEHCPNYPYAIKGDKGFKAAYDAQVMVIAE